MSRVVWCLLFCIVAGEAKLSNYDGQLTRDVYHTFLKHLHEGYEVTNHAINKENESEYWLKGGQDTLKEKLGQRLNTNRAKNVIMFLGDGCSFSTWFATRVYKARQQNQNGGEEFKLSVEHFPYSGLSKTYCVDSQVADSACSATAYHTGVKGNIGTIGVNGQVPFNDCEASVDPCTHTVSIAKAFQDAGLKTGIVTTTRVTHASPAGAYASVASREWENDAHVQYDNADPTQCPDIAMQLIHGDTGKNLNVILGGGWQNFLPTNETDPAGQPGQRADGKNLIDEWIQAKGDCGAYVSNKDELLDACANIDYLLGIFSTSHLAYHLTNVQTQPTLKEMTQAAIKQLSGDKGYFLFVEGGRIDHGHHDTKAVKALDETAQFDEAIAAAVAMTNTNDTLILVTSDHSHDMVVSGYAKRGTNIFGIAGKGSDGIAYSTLSYAAGKHGFKQGPNGSRYDISKDDRRNMDYRFPALVPKRSGAHTGEDVGIFCSGPWAHLCSGVMEQNTIPHLIGYAACVGSGLKSCDSLNSEDSSSDCDD